MVVLRGMDSWRRIKTSAAEQRQLWRDVGEALNVGRRLHPSNQAFGAWCKERGFDMSRNARTDAMWFALHSDCATDAPAEVSHPTNIRQWHRESQDTTEPAATLPQDAPVTTAATRAAKPS